jgi:hypothetical protein
MAVTYSTDANGVLTATFTGTGELTGATADLNGATVAIIVGYSSIGNQAFLAASALTSITIPASVTSIGDYAFYATTSLNTVTFEAGSSLNSIETGVFYQASALTSIIIPASVTSIGTNAFYQASALTTVTFEADSSLTSIGSNAFLAASALTSITIPASVTSIGDYAFYFASGLTSIAVNSNNVHYKDINGVLFNKEGTILIQYPVGNTRTIYTIPEGVISIGEYAFANASALTSITIPASVTSIGTNAFYLASALTSVTFETGSSLTSIGSNAFLDSSVTTVIASQPLIDTMEWSTTVLNDISGKSDITVSTPPPPIPPPIPICFPAGTPVTTDQGLVAIEKLNTDKHTIRGKEIVAITQTRPLQKHIVCFEKDSLSKNVPSQETRCSMQHKVFYKREMMKASDIVTLCENVSLVPYNGETLYNVLLKKQDKMMINNLICETLDPKNIMAKISTMKDGQKKNKAICQLTKIIKENNVPEYQKLYASL